MLKPNNVDEIMEGAKLHHYVPEEKDYELDIRALGELLLLTQVAVFQEIFRVLDRANHRRSKMVLVKYLSDQGIPATQDEVRDTYTRE